MGQREQGLAALAGERFDVAKLRVEVRLAEKRLEQLDDFERRWNVFERRLSGILVECERRRLKYWGPALAGRIRNAEDSRLDLASRAPTVLPDCQGPLNKLLRTSLRTDSSDLWELIGVEYEYTETEPHDDEELYEGDLDDEELEDEARIEEGPFYVPSARQFEITAEQARAEIARHQHHLKAQITNLQTMLEEAQSAAADEHQRNVEDAGRTDVTASRAERFWDRYGREIVIGVIVTVIGGVLLTLLL